MGLLVDVSIVPGEILKAFQARILANRERLRRQQEANAARGRRRKGGGIREQLEEEVRNAGRRGSSAPPSTYRPDEPTGNPQQPYWLGSGGLFFQYDNSEAGGGRLDIRATSGNGLVTVTGTTSVWNGTDPTGYGRNVIPRALLDPSKPVPGTPIDNGYRFADPITGEVDEYIMPGDRQTGWAQLIARKTAGWFPLPLDKDAAVLIGVAVARYSRSWTRAYRATTPDPFTYTNFGDFTTRHEVVAFLCTHTTVRQLEVPASFRTLMQTVFPTDERALVQNPDTDPAVPLLWDPPPLPAPRVPGPAVDPQQALYTYGARRGISTPSVYSVLANYAILAADPGLNVQAFAAVRPFLPEDARNLPFIAATPGFPSRVYRWRAPIPALLAGLDPGPPGGLWVMEDFNPRILSPSIWWDWNLPSYCREQLLALGFRAADLNR